jgi:hypothetical protein
VKVSERVRAVAPELTVRNNVEDEVVSEVDSFLEEAAHAAAILARHRGVDR